MVVYRDSIDLLQEDYYSYCRRPRRTILEVLADFPSAVAGFESAYLLDLIPGLKPRAFSIASSMSVSYGLLIFNAAKPSTDSSWCCANLDGCC